MRRWSITAHLLAEATSQMYEAGAGLGQWSDALTTIAKATGSRYAALQGASRDGSTPLLFVYDSGLGERVLDPYARFTAEHGDPRIDYALRHPDEIFTDFAFTDERAMRGHPYYKDLLEPLGLYYGAVVEFAPDGVDWAAGISLHRSKHEGPFDSNALRLFAEVARHGKRALLMAHRLLQTGVKAAVAEALLGADAAGYVLLDGRGRIIEMNAAASRMIAESETLQIDNRELRSNVSSKERALRHAIRASSSAAASATIPMGRLAVEIYPLHSERWPVGLPVKSMAVVTERRTACQCEARAAGGEAACPPNEPQCVDALGGCYGLTRSESVVVFGLCRGQSVAEIAEQRGTTRDAVRFHLKNVFQKLHVKRQSELVRRIATGPVACVLDRRAG